MHTTTQIPRPFEDSRPTYSSGAAFAAGLGWALFFIVPALFLAAWQESSSGADDNSASIFVIMIVFAITSVISAAFGAIRGSGATRTICLVLLALQIFPMVTRSGLFL